MSDRDINQAKAMDRRTFITRTAAGLGAAAFPSFPGSHPPSSSRPLPNIVLIFMDDMGYADIGCFGAEGYETPNIDRLAAEGTRFTSFYASQAVCSASRASLMTGCYAERVGIQGALMPWVDFGLNPEEETIADILKKRGYATGIFGKWHLGSDPSLLPLNHGFDEYVGLPYSNDMWPVNYDGSVAKTGYKAFCPPLPLIQGDKKTWELKNKEDQSKLTGIYTERALSFIDRHYGGPFFLYIPHSMPHIPLAASEPFRNKSKRGVFGDVIQEIDDSVGRILKSLETHGIEKNTLVIFTSDNGPWLSFGNHAGSAGPLREGKMTMWEGGPRVPCVMRWPGRIPAGGICRKMASTIDILPTAARIAGAPLPKKKIDGVDITPLITGMEGASPRDRFYFYYGGELRAVRKGKWKLYFPHLSITYRGVDPGKEGFPGPTGTYKCGLELYNLEEDLSETRDEAEKYPGIVQELEKLAQEARADLGDRLSMMNGPGKREPGRIPSRRTPPVRHLASGLAVSLSVPPHPTFAEAGAKLLTDGIRGSGNPLDGKWLGFKGSGFEAIVDLGQVREVKQISCGFLRDQVSRTFLPAGLELAVSEDNQTFQAVWTFTEANELNTDALAKTYNAEFDPLQARFIRIRAQNPGVCPEWHHTPGAESWLLIDEIIVR